MRKLLIPALVVGVLAVGVPMAEAANAKYQGGCGFVAISDPTPDGNLGGQNVFTGEVDWQVVLYDDVDAADNPISGVVSCELQVNGVVHDSTVPTAVTVVGAGADVLTYTRASATDVVELCTVITNWSDGSPNTRDCGGATTFQIPPQEVIDLIDLLFTTLDDTLGPVIDLLNEEVIIPFVDPTLCQGLIAIAPVVNAAYPVTEIWVDPDDGDVWDAFPDPEQRIWDCDVYGDAYNGPTP